MKQRYPCLVIDSEDWEPIARIKYFGMLQWVLLDLANDLYEHSAE